MIGIRLSAPGLAAAAVLLTASMPQPPADRENAYRSNNVGVALLEQFNYDEAAGAFRRALTLDSDLQIARLNLAIALLYAGKGDEALATAQDAAKRLPNVPQTHYIVGLAARAQGQPEAALAAFQRVLQSDASDAGSRVNMGQIHLAQRQFPEAIALFREAVAAEPFNATAAYGLAIALTRSGAADEGRTAMQRFETLRDAPYAVTYSQTYLEQGRYGEAIASTGAEPDLVDPAPPAVTFVDATEATLPQSWRLRPRALYKTGEFHRGGSVALFDADADADLDLYAVDTFGQRLYINQTRATSRVFADVTSARGLASTASEAAPAALVADVDNDRRPDILSLHPDGLRLFHQRADGRFEDVTVKAGIERSPEHVAAGALVDVDHDGDLDIFLAGDGVPTSKTAADRLLRNKGDGTFSDAAAAAGLGNSTIEGIAVAPTDFDNRRDIDLLVLGRTGAPRLFKNARDGTFKEVAAEVGLPGTGAYTALAAGDVNKDGYTDFFFGRIESPGLLALSDGQGRFTVVDGPPTAAARGVPGQQAASRVAAQFLDYDNDGLLDLFVATGASVQLFRNLGGKWLDVSERVGFAALTGRPDDGHIVDVASGDVDRDGDLDLFVLRSSGQLRLWRNDGGNTQRSLLVQLAGRVSNRHGVGAKIDVRAGSLRQRIETSSASPALGPADVLFGLGRRTGADVVRVIWPSGTLQSETIGQVRTTTVTELDRKPSSCPYLYAWNGTRFEFVTDFMGGGEIGYWHGPGAWNTPDPNEYVRIPPGQLVPRDGRYEMRVTNELEEALFVDQLRLLAVDHPQDVEVFPNEGLGAPASAAVLTATHGARPPVAATDDHGHDVLTRLQAIDRQYPDDFRLLDIRGYAEPHALRLDLGRSSPSAVLLATAWTDYAFSSDNVAAHQRGLSLSPPALEVRTTSGAWRRLIDNIGIPVGRPQTVVVDLRGKLRPGEHEVRILTNMRIYWDQILVDTSGETRITRITRIDPLTADLRWRGFSAEVTPDGRQPFTYDYARVSRDSPWKIMVGRYTREGDVRELLRSADDMFVIARTGDEIALSFDASALPPLERGQSRTFLLYAFGFSKEMDITSASPHFVAPLPFRAMRRYPYRSDENYPTTEAHRAYQAKYNTRVVSRPLPPIETSWQK